MILFIGDEPSACTDPKKPFRGAKCEKRLLGWIKQLTTGRYRIVNRVDPEFEIAVFVASLKDYPIVALGNKASAALNKMKHFKLPHPSGRNKKLNDKESVKSILKQCREWLEGK